MSNIKLQENIRSGNFTEDEHRKKEKKESSREIKQIKIDKFLKADNELIPDEVNYLKILKSINAKNILLIKNKSIASLAFINKIKICLTRIK